MEKRYLKIEINAECKDGSILTSGCMTAVDVSTQEIMQTIAGSFYKLSKDMEIPFDVFRLLLDCEMEDIESAVTEL